MNAADIIGDFGSAYTVTRRAAAVATAGKLSPGGTSTVQIVAAEVPATPNVLLRLPEERRSIETRRWFTTTLLLTGGQGAPNESDLIAVDGELWEVQSVAGWKEADEPFFDVLAQAVR